jgi:hypothetical protein
MSLILNLKIKYAVTGRYQPQKIKFPVSYGELTNNNFLKMINLSA